MCHYSGIPTFRTTSRKANWCELTGSLKSRGYNLSGEGKLNLVRIIGNFEKLRVREIGILLCFVTSSGGKM